VDLDSFELDGIKIFTRFWGMLMFGCYSVINIVVLLNLLIAMMNHSYQLISVSGFLTGVVGRGTKIKRKKFIEGCRKDIGRFEGFL
jgi:hypothetical protein